MQAEISPHTQLSLTVTNHTTHGLYSHWPHVYFQDALGRIRSASRNDGGTSTIVVNETKLNQGFAAVSWGS